VTGNAGAPIIIDIDGTLYDATPLLAECLARRHGIVLVPAEYKEWNWWNVLLTHDEIGHLFDDDFHAPEAIMSAVPYEGAVEAVTAWQSSGHPIHIISHRLPEKDAPTLAWLNKIGIFPDAFVNSYSINKVAYAIKHGAALIVDDKPEIIRDAVAAGVCIATIIHPYNGAVIAELGGTVIAASDWRTLAALVSTEGVLVG
jgi:phosphoglycolate phosphatase-like HAD superfamily hydrolase